MGWGTDFKADIYISKIKLNKYNVEYLIKETEKDIDYSERWLIGAVNNARGTNIEKVTETNLEVEEELESLRENYSMLRDLSHFKYNKIPVKNYSAKDFRYCPECGFYLEGKEIPNELMESGHYKSMEGAEIAAESYGWTKKNKKCFSKVIGIEDPNVYDGINWWQCPNCKAAWDRFTGDLRKN